MKKAMLIIMAVMLTLLGGCGYADEIDEQAFLVALGIDKGKTYNVRATFVFANPSGGGEEKSGSGTKSKKTEIITVEAPTVYSAIRQLNSIKSKSLEMSHTKIIVFSKDIAKEGVEKFILGFASARDFRPNTYVCVSRCDAEKYLREVKPAQEIFVEKYFDLIMKKVASDKVNESYLYYLYYNIVGKSLGSAVPLVDVNKNKLPDTENPVTQAVDDFALNLKAGELIRKGENETEVVGCSVFREGIMVGEIGNVYFDILRLIRFEFPDNFYSVKYPGSEDYVTIRLMQEQAPHISAKIKKGNPEITVKIPVRAEYVDLGNAMKTENDFKTFEKYVNSELKKRGKKLIKKAQTDYKCDIFGFADLMKRKFVDVKEWEEYNWEEKFLYAEIKIKFDLKIVDFEETNKSPARGNGG